MSTNISQEKRKRLLEKIEEIRKFLLAAQESEVANKLLSDLAEIEKEISAKKFGLVFEEHVEEIDRLLDDCLPVLKEVDSLKINGKKYNFLIEGDNLAALELLKKTHAGMIDIIYIDPPYNTGKKDFVYDDSFVDANDTFRHSKWLSFMKKRLEIAKALLSKEGIIFISVDDNELSELKLLCDGIFDERCFINNFMWLHGKGKKNKQSRTLQQYILAYGRKDRDFLPEWVTERFAKGSFSNPDNDPRGDWFSGSISFSEDRSNKNSENYFEITSPSGVIWQRQWQCSRDEMDKYLAENKIYFGRPPKFDQTPRLKIFPTDKYQVIPDNIISGVGTTRSAQKELDKIIGTTVNEKGQVVSKFDNPKPHELIEHLIEICDKGSDITVLDFFAGSGTTGHAVMELNAKDNGQRKFILCTNNENNICRDVTYERLKKVIENQGYDAGLKYLQVGFVEKKDKFYYEYAGELLKRVRELIELENFVDLSSSTSCALVCSEEDFDSFTTHLPETCRTVYLSNDILPTEEQEQLLIQNNIKVNIVPEYYYSDLED